MIRFEDVSVTYRGGVQALRGLNLTIGDGEFIVIVGLSGAGKSTLLRALNGLVPATGGSITVDDTDNIYIYWTQYFGALFFLSQSYIRNL